MKRENKELKEVQDDLINQKKKRNDGQKENSQGAFTKQENVVFWRQKLNGIKDSIKQKKRQLLNLQDKLNELNLVRNTTFEETPHHQQIRILENELDTVIIKYNEAQSIRNTYEQIVKKIKEERVGYDNQIQIIERTLKGKYNDYADLLLLSKQGIHSREQAQSELQSLQKEFDAVQKKRENYLKVKQSTIDKKISSIQRERQAQKEKHEQETMRLQMMERKKTAQKNQNQTVDILSIKEEIILYQDAFEELKKQTGSNDVNEIIQKYLIQEETRKSLEELETKYLAEIQEKKELKNNLKVMIEEKKESLQMVEHEEDIGKADSLFSKKKMAMEQAVQKKEKLTKTLIQLQQGIEHMFNRMNFVKPEDEETNLHFNQEESPFIRLIKNLSQKIKLTYEVVKKNQRFNDSTQYKRLFYDANAINENFVDPNLFSPNKHIIYNEFKEEIKKKTNAEQDLESSQEEQSESSYDSKNSNN